MKTNRKLALALSAAMALNINVPSVQAATGTGTADDPYLIDSIDDFLAIDTTGDQTLGMYYKLTSDLSFAGYDFATNPYIPIGTADDPFEGFFDGDGHTISGVDMAYEAASDILDWGLFGYVRGSIMNLRLSDISVNAAPDVDPHPGDQNYQYHVGSLAGVLQGSISKITVDEQTHVLGANLNETVGGVVGDFNGTATQIDTLANVYIDAVSYSAGSLFGSASGLVARVLDGGEVELAADYANLSWAGSIGLASDLVFKDACLSNTIKGKYSGDTGAVAGHASGVELNRVKVNSGINLTNAGGDGNYTNIGTLGGRGAFEIDNVVDNVTVVHNEGIKYTLHAAMEANVVLPESGMHSVVNYFRTPVHSEEVLRDPISSLPPITYTADVDAALAATNWLDNDRAWSDAYYLKMFTPAHFVAVSSDASYINGRGTKEDSVDKTTTIMALPDNFKIVVTTDESVSYTDYDMIEIVADKTIGGDTFNLAADPTVIITNGEPEVSVPYIKYREFGALDVTLEFYDHFVSEETKIDTITAMPQSFNELVPGTVINKDNLPTGQTTTQNNVEFTLDSVVEDSVTIEANKVQTLTARYVADWSANPTYTVVTEYYVVDATGTETLLDTVTSDPNTVAVGDTVGISDDCSVVISAPEGWRIKEADAPITAQLPGANYTFKLKLVRDANDVDVSVEEEYIAHTTAGTVTTYTKTTDLKLQAGTIIGLDGEDGVTYPVYATYTPVGFTDYNTKVFTMTAHDNPITLAEDPVEPYVFHIKYEYSETPSVGLEFTSPDTTFTPGDDISVTLTVTNISTNAVTNIPVQFNDSYTFRASDRYTVAEDVVTIGTLAVGESFPIVIDYHIDEETENGTDVSISAECTYEGTLLDDATFDFTVTQEVGSYVVKETYVTITDEGEELIDGEVTHDTVSNVAAGKTVGITEDCDIQITPNPAYNGVEYTGIENVTPVTVIADGVVTLEIKHSREIEAVYGAYQVVHTYKSSRNGKLTTDGIVQDDPVVALAGRVVGISTEDVEVNVEVTPKNVYDGFGYQLSDWENVTLIEGILPQTINLTYIRIVPVGSYQVEHIYYNYNEKNELVEDGRVLEDVVEDVEIGTNIGIDETNDIVIEKVLTYNDNEYEFSDAAPYMQIAESDTPQKYEIKYIRKGASNTPVPAMEATVSTLNDSYKKGSKVTYNVTVKSTGTADLSGVYITPVTDATGVWEDSLLFDANDQNELLINEFPIDGEVTVKYTVTIPRDFEGILHKFDFKVSATELNGDNAVTASKAITLLPADAVLGQYKVVYEYYTITDGVEKLVHSTADDAETQEAPVGVPLTIDAAATMEYEDEVYTLDVDSVLTITPTDTELTTVTVKYIRYAGEVLPTEIGVKVTYNFYAKEGDTEPTNSVQEDTYIFEADKLEDEIENIEEMFSRVKTHGGDTYLLWMATPEMDEVIDGLTAGRVSLVTISYVKATDTALSLSNYKLADNAEVGLGKTVSYEVEVANDGLAAAEDVSLTVAGIEKKIESIPAGEAVSVAFDLPIPETLVDGVYTFDIKLEHASLEEAVEQEDTIKVFTGADVKLTLKVATDSDVALSGQPVVFAVTLTNEGTVPVTNVNLYSTQSSKLKLVDNTPIASEEVIQPGQSVESKFEYTPEATAKSATVQFNAECDQMAMSGSTGNPKASKTITFSDMTTTSAITGFNTHNGYYSVNYVLSLPTGITKLTNVKLTSNLAVDFDGNPDPIGTSTEYLVPEMTSTLTLSIIIPAENRVNGEELTISMTCDEGYTASATTNIRVSETPTPSGAPTNSPSPAPSGTPTDSPSPAPSGQPTNSPAPSGQPTNSPTPSPVPTNSPTPSNTPNPVNETKQLTVQVPSWQNPALNSSGTVNVYVQNSGNTVLNNVVITPSFTGGVTGNWENVGYPVTGNNVLNIGTMVAGQTLNLAFKMQTPATATAGTQMVWTFTGTCTELPQASALSTGNFTWYVPYSGTTDNGNGNGNVTVTSKNANAKLQMSVTEDKTSYKPGETIVYTVVVKNNTNATMEDIKVTCTAEGTWEVPQGLTADGKTLNVGSLNAGATASFKFSAVIPNDIAEGASFVNTITASAKNVTPRITDGTVVTITYKNNGGTLTKVASTASPKTSDDRDVNPLVEKFFTFVYGLFR